MSLSRIILFHKLRFVVPSTIAGKYENVNEDPPVASTVMPLKLSMFSSTIFGCKIFGSMVSYILLYSSPSVAYCYAECPQGMTCLGFGRVSFFSSSVS